MVQSELRDSSQVGSQAFIRISYVVLVSLVWKSTGWKGLQRADEASLGEAISEGEMFIAVEAPGLKESWRETEACL